MSEQELRWQLAETQRNLLRCRTILEAISVHTWVTDAYGSVASIIAGEPTPPGHGETAVAERLALVHPADQERLGLEMVHALSTGDPLDTVVVGLNADQEWRKLKIYGRPIRNTEGQIEEWVGVSTDVTRQVEAEEALKKKHEILRESQELLSVALSASQMGVWEYDLESQAIHFSPDTYSILQLGRSIKCASDFNQYVHPEDLPTVTEVFYKSLEEKSSFRVEYRFQSQDGSYRWLANVGKPYYNDHGKPSRMIGTVEDITERRIADEWLRTRNQVLQLIAAGCPVDQLNDSLVEMVETALPNTTAVLLLTEPNSRPQLIARQPLPEAMLQATHALYSSGDLRKLHEVGGDSVDARPESSAAADSLWTMSQFPTTDDWQHHRAAILDHGYHNFCSAPLMAFNSPAASQNLDRWGWLIILRRDSDQLNDAQRLRCTQVVQLVAIAVERQRHEQSLRESEHRFRELANSVPQLVWTTDPDGKCVYSNQLLKDTIGPVGEQDWLSIVHPDDRQEVACRFESAVKAGEVYTCEHRLKVHRTGEYRWYLARASASRNANGDIGGWYGVAADIDDLKRTEATLREERDRISAIAAASPGVIFSCAYCDDGRVDISYAAPTFTDLLGIAPAEITRDPAPLIKMLAPDELEMIRDAARRSASEMSPGAVTFQLEHPTKGTIWIECQASPRRDLTGTIHWHGVLTDVTQRKFLEKKLLQSERMEAIGRLAGGIAHDFNNLLTVILGSCELLEPQLPDRLAVRENFEAIQQASFRAARLTRQLLTFSRQREALPQYVDPNCVIRDAHLILQRLVGSKVFIIPELATNINLVHIDPLQLEQVMINLVVNARDAMHAGGQIIISTRNIQTPTPHDRLGEGNSVSRFVEISVSDTGIGIHPELQTRVFEPFFTTKEPGKGTGLGLAVVHGVVSQCGGQVEFESKVGQGTTVRVLLPAIPAVPRHENPSRHSHLGVDGGKAGTSH